MNEEFKTLSPQEFEALSKEEQAKYLTDKAANDARVAKENAEKAGETAAKNYLENNKPAAGISKEDFEDYKTKTEQMIENIGKSVGNKTENTMTNIAKQFEDQYQERTKDLDKNKLVEGNITMKAWTSTDTMVANDVTAATYPAAGATSVVSGVLSFFSRLIPGFYRKPRPVSKIYDYVTVIPTEDEISVTAISENIIGSAELVKECELKPIVKVEYESKTVEMKYVAVFWKISRVLIRVFKRMGVDLQKRFNDLIMEAIPNRILDVVKDAAVPFTAVPDLAVHANPNNFDVAISVFAYLEKMGYTPNTMLLSPYAYANMLTLKASDGHYMLSNGGSIKIVGSTIDYGGTPIELVKDPTLGNDEFIIGDLTIVQAYIDGNVEYHQGYNDTDDLRKNLVGNVLEQLIAVIIPEGAETGIITDTFSNVKNLITQA